MLDCGSIKGFNALQLLLTLKLKGMKKYDVYAGIDVSKLKIDVCLIRDVTEKKHLHLVYENNKKGIFSLLHFIKKEGLGESVLFAFENTGVYSMPLCYWLQSVAADYCVISSLEIKRAKGISRGKNDKVDAQSIAFYSITHNHQLKLFALPGDKLIELRLLL